jgi:hypothetical protein
MKNKIWITETQANKLQALGVPVDIGYVIDAALVASFTDIMASEKPAAPAKGKPRRKRGSTSPTFTHVATKHDLQLKVDEIFPSVDSSSPVSLQAKKALYAYMHSYGIHLLSRKRCYEILVNSMPDVFVVPKYPPALSGVLFTVAHSSGFLPRWNDESNKIEEEK